MNIKKSSPARAKLAAGRGRIFRGVDKSGKMDYNLADHEKV